MLVDFFGQIFAWKLAAQWAPMRSPTRSTLALKASGLDHVMVVHRPRLLSENGSPHVSEGLAKSLSDEHLGHVRGANYHPYTQGKIERWHRTLKNCILLDNCYLPSALERQVAAFVSHYNRDRNHESLDNVTPADVSFGRAPEIMAVCQRIRRMTIANRRLQHQLRAA